VACLALFATSARAENFWYIQDAKNIPLIPRPARVAVLSNNPDALAPIGADARIAPIEDFAIPGWHILSIEDSARAGDLRARIDAIAHTPGVSLATPVFDGPAGPGVVMLTDEVFVRFAEGIDRPTQDGAVAEIPGASVLDHDYAGITRLARIRIASRNALDALDAANLLATRPDVEFAEPDFIFTGTGNGIPNDTDFADQWALQNTGQLGGTPGIDIRATVAFDLEPGDPSTLIVVLDTGVDATHPDLSLAPGADFTTDLIPHNGSPANSCDRHGTWVAGCVSATINNNLGIAGGAGLCRVASARIGISNASCNLSWSGQLQWTVDALNWAQSIGARVTNNSNAYSITSSAIRTKYEELEAAGIIHFAAAGNDGSSGVTYPASLGAVQGVGALNRTGALAPFSNYGSGLTYTAPGEDILSTDRVGPEGSVPGDFIIVDGTSFSSPYAASAAALVATMKPGLGAFDIEDILIHSVTDLGATGYDSTFGYGLINARAALELAACWDSWAPTGTSGPSPRTNHAMVYDTARGVGVLFGGLPGASAVGDTWEHSGTTWVQIPVAGPSARYGHAMAYDSARGVTVLFGGLVGAVQSNETWEYDGSTWTLVSTTGPSARFLHAMAYDSARHRTVLFGGRVGSNANDETWEWDGASWTQVSIPGPSARNYHAMAFDAARERIVLFGGTTGANETWTYLGPDGVDPGSWTLASPSGPLPRERAALAFDARTSTVVLFGGLSGSTTRTDTWEWNGASWRLRTTAGATPRSRHTMVYRDDEQDTLAFGGIDASSIRLGDSWTWMLPAPTVNVPPAPESANIGDTVQFTVVADGIGALAYQWRREGVDLVDGARISGAATAALTITDVQPEDLGLYSVRIDDPCGSTVSVSAPLSLACAGDITGDGDTNVSDFNILASNFGGGPGATLADGDLTGDGFINVADFNILAGDFGCFATP